VSRSDRELLADALSHLEVLRAHQMRRDLDDQTVADAVCLRLSAAIESVANITDDLRSDAFGEDWPLIWARRNRIAHGYAFIDRSMIASTIDNDLPGFEAAIRRLLDDQS
jgi:uncharacterized protein with HEPN domain